MVNSSVCENEADARHEEVRGCRHALLTCVVGYNGSVGPLNLQACLKCCLSVVRVLSF